MGNYPLLRAYRNITFAGVLALVLVVLLGSLQTGLSLGCGMIIGVFPFLSWKILIRQYITKMTKTLVNQIILMFIVLIKLGLVMAVLYLLFRAKWIGEMPFIIGLILTQPVMIISILIVPQVVE